MRILLLTDIPPTSQLTAGLVLDRLCRFLPAGSVACFAVVNPAIDVALSAELAGTPIHYVDKPREASFSSLAGRRVLRRLAGWLYGLYHRHVAVPRLVGKAARFGKAHNVDAVWVTLQGQTLVHMAVPLARRLKAPLFTLVWDPLSWWLKANDVEPISARAAQKAFDAAISESQAVATASWAMSQYYEERYGVFTVPVIASHDISIAQPAATQIKNADELVIGMAGQFYAIEEWQQVLTALNACGWRIDGRDVSLRIAGHYVPPSEIPEGRARVLGWLSHNELIAEMAKCDLLYCPYPFDRGMEEVSRLSFPSKLTTYLACGRPVLFHGPDWSSPGQYIAKNAVGVVTAGVHASAVYNAVELLVKDAELYRTSAANAALAFRRDFTFEKMRSAFFEMLGLDVASPPQETFEPVAPVDERDPRRRTVTASASSEGLTMRCLSFLPGIRAARRQMAELADWKAVHMPEIVALYAHVRRLDAQIEDAERRRSTDLAELRARLGEAHIRRRQDRMALQRRDELLASMLPQHDAAMRKMAVRVRSVQAESAGRVAAARKELDQRDEEIASLRRRLAAAERALAPLREKLTALMSKNPEVGGVSHHER